jgi:L-serine dehydratase
MTAREGTLAAYRNAAEEAGVTLADIFLRQEAASSGKSESQLRDLMLSRIQVMRQAMEKGLAVPQHSRSRLIRGGAARMNQWLGTGSSLLGPAFSRMVAAALAVAEVNACMGRVVAAPTAGACGVLPAAIFTVAEARQVDQEAVLRAFFTRRRDRAGHREAGLPGRRRGRLPGRSGVRLGHGCRRPGGAHGRLRRPGGPRRGLRPGQRAGAHLRPVGGLVEVPCVKRNVMGAVNAAACAEMALAGLESVFPADAVIETMGKVGRRLPEEFRETARGGLAAIPRP